MTTGTITPPLCRNCHKPRRPRKTQPGYRGANGWCDRCYSRWLKAGRPAEGPPPPITASEAAALSNAVQRGAREPASMSLSLAALSWYSRAGCDGMDTDLFFPAGPGTPPDPLVMAACGSCPVRRDCLNFAIATSQKGIWAGLTEEERARERRRRNRMAAA